MAEPAREALPGEAGPVPARVVVGQELRLVGGHVHAHRAFLAAAGCGSHAGSRRAAPAAPRRPPSPRGSRACVPERPGACPYPPERRVPSARRWSCPATREVRSYSPRCAVTQPVRAPLGPLEVLAPATISAATSVTLTWRR